MKTKLLWFKNDYTAQLRVDATADRIERYRADRFAFDETRTDKMGIEIDDEICSQMYGDVEHEFEDAIILYEALRNLPRSVAADEDFWVSLAHTIFFPYMKKRWGKDGLAKKEILNHWFFKNGMTRHALGGLWWAVKLTVDEIAVDDKYKLTKVVFWNYSFRTTFMGPSIFYRIENARKGVLRFLADHESELRKGMENIGRYIAKYLNQLGATKQLAALPEEYFYQEMTAHIEDMKAYEPRKKYDGDGAF